MTNLNNLIGVSQDMHFALLNASRGNIKAAEDTQKKNVPKHAAQVKNKSAADTQSNNPNTSDDSSTTSGSNTNNSINTNDSTSTDTTTLPPFMQKMMNANVESCNYVLICMSIMLLVGMAPQTQQLNDLAAITGAAQRVTNDVTTIMGFFSTVEEGAQTGNGGLPSNFFSSSNEGNLQGLESACAAVADLFFSDPSNSPLSSYGVSYQGTTYVPMIQWNASTNTASITWVNLNNPPSDLPPNELNQITNNQPASDLQVLLCAMFQYQADLHFNPKDPSSEPSAQTLQGQIDSSLSALGTLINFGSGANNKYMNWSVFQYMVTIGAAVNHFHYDSTLSPSNQYTGVVPVVKINSYLESQGAIFFGVGVVDDVGDFEGMIASWAHGYAENNNPATSNSKYQQGSQLDTFYKYLQNVQNNGSTKSQEAMSKAKINTTNVSDMQQIGQSIIKSNSQSMQTVVSNYKSS